MRALKKFREALIASLHNMGVSYPLKTSIEPPKDIKHGDLATNIAMLLGKELGKNPREIASTLVEHLKKHLPSEKLEIAGPGFINITFTPAFWQLTLDAVQAQKSQYGAHVQEHKRKILIEYVSANPTGPLHIGHGRGAAVGDSLTRILNFAGHNVSTEYYVNDAGNQMRTLGLSVWLRALELAGKNPTFPESYYKGDYIIDIAKDLMTKKPDLLNLDKETAIDICYEYSMNVIADGIKEDLHAFRVHHDLWFSEKSLVESNEVAHSFENLEKKGLAYKEDNALWFNTTQFGDDKNRVLIKSDGNLTYFASDIAYHDNKYNRGFDLLIDIWGADHHGYVPRMKAAIAALGKNPEADFGVILIQLVNLLRAGQPIAMSTRSGEFETLADVVKEVGVDATRFMFLSRKSDSPLDFDLELVKERTLENPVYYVQYAHARIFGILRRVAENNMVISLETLTTEEKSLLDTAEDISLLRTLDQFEEAILAASNQLSVHTISYYLMDLAGKIHSYYGKHQILGENTMLTKARLQLLLASAQVLSNGLYLLGVEAPQKM